MVAASIDCEQFWFEFHTRFVVLASRVYVELPVGERIAMCLKGSLTISDAFTDLVFLTIKSAGMTVDSCMDMGHSWVAHGSAGDGSIIHAG